MKRCDVPAAMVVAVDDDERSPDDGGGTVAVSRLEIAGLRLPENASFSLDIKTTSGDIRTTFPVTIDGSSDRGRNSLLGNVGTGGPDIKIKTVSGDVDVVR